MNVLESSSLWFLCHLNSCRYSDLFGPRFSIAYFVCILSVIILETFWETHVYNFIRNVLLFIRTLWCWYVATEWSLKLSVWLAQLWDLHMIEFSFLCNSTLSSSFLISHLDNLRECFLFRDIINVLKLMMLVGI